MRCNVCGKIKAGVAIGIVVCSTCIGAYSYGKGDVDKRPTPSPSHLVSAPISGATGTLSNSDSNLHMRAAYNGGGGYVVNYYELLQTQTADHIDRLNPRHYRKLMIELSNSIKDEKA